jgi:hypothetical protein
VTEEPTEPTDILEDPGRSMRSRVKDAVDSRDAATLVALLDPMPLSAVMRQLLALSVDDRDVLLSLLLVDLARSIPSVVISMWAAPSLCWVATAPT